jgi:hypothetical protein
MIKSKSIYIALLATATLSSAYAFDISGYQSLSTIETKQVTVPTVVELSGTVAEPFLIVSTDGTTPQVQSEVKEKMVLPTSVQACKGDVCTAEPGLLDGSRDTTVDYFLGQAGTNNGSIKVTYQTPITTNQVDFETTSDSYRPSEFSLFADGKLILAGARPGETKFPRITGTTFEIQFSYDKPIRFTEAGVGYTKNVEKRVRFVYEPGKVYQVYSGGTRKTDETVRASANLFDATRVVTAIALTGTTANPSFNELDTDSDGIADARDNCASAANSDQQDGDKNGVGDACDDYDFDGVATYKDNCSQLTNPDQRDTDGDGLGDACDGEESRVTEKYKWLQWVALLLVFAAIGVMGRGVYKAAKSGTKVEPTQE